MLINFPTYEQQQQAITLLQEIGVDIDTLLAGRVVKSIQRGLAMGSTSNDVNITISSINPQKSFVILDGLHSHASNTTTFPSILPPRLSLLTSTKLTVLGGAGYSVTQFSWQVIEFY